MKIKPEQLEQIAALLLASYKKNELMVGKVPEAAIQNKIIDVIGKNFADEEAIEEEARKMLATLPQTSRDVDPFKMFLLAKQKLAAKKGFVL